MKQKKQLALLAVLVLILVVVGYLYFDSDKPTVTADGGATAQDYKLLPVDNLILHKDGVDKARKTEYKSSGRNIFSRELPTPKPTPAEIKKLNEQRAQEIAQPAPVIIPKVSPLPVKFFGYGTIPNGTARVAFFSEGDGDVYVVKEGELLLNRFRILKIGNANLEYEEVSTGLRGTANLEEQGGPPSA
jgi:hypothetical protein